MIRKPLLESLGTWKHPSFPGILLEKCAYIVIYCNIHIFRCFKLLHTLTYSTCLLVWPVTCLSTDPVHTSVPFPPKRHAVLAGTQTRPICLRSILLLKAERVCSCLLHKKEAQWAVREGKSCRWMSEGHEKLPKGHWGHAISLRSGCDQPCTSLQGLFSCERWILSVGTVYEITTLFFFANLKAIFFPRIFPKWASRRFLHIYTDQTELEVRTREW